MASGKVVAAGPHLSFSLLLKTTLPSPPEAAGEEAAVLSAVVVEDLASEVAVAVGFGPGDHAMTVLGSTTSEPDAGRTAMVRDLWDEMNVVPPIPTSMDMGQKLQALIQEVAMTTEAAAGPGACGGC